MPICLPNACAASVHCIARARDGQMSRHDVAQQLTSRMRVVQHTAPCRWLSLPARRGLHDGRLSFSIAHHLALIVGRVPGLAAEN